MSNLENSVIFPKGDPVPEKVSKYFTGQPYLHMLTGFESGVPIGNVTFEPGCRNNWHKHPGGQILLVTGGRGWYQEWGKEAQELHAGDVVVIPKNCKHWHGAAMDSWFVHLAVETGMNEGPAEWLESITDEEYKKLGNEVPIA